VTPDAVALAVDHHRYAVAVARRVIRDPVEARSFAGVAICQAAQEWVEQGVEGEFRPWAATFVRRRAVDETRRLLGRRGQRLAVVEPQSFEDPIGDGLTLEGAIATPDDDFQAVEDRDEQARTADAVWAQVNLLPSRHRRLAEGLAEGRSKAQMAVEFGVDPSRVSQLCRRLREVLEGVA
jgi:RNA polymerase sigma factor (sigma-70 family)